MVEPIILVVLGYGCRLTERVKKYLDSVVEFTRHNNCSAIITCGGATQGVRPERTEADVMAAYLFPFVTPLTHREETALTTLQSLRAIKRLLWRGKVRGSRVVIFCDHAHRFKVKLLARIELGIWPEVHTYPLTVGRWPVFKQLFIATPLDVLAALVPVLEKLAIKRKERIIERS